MVNPSSTQEGSFGCGLSVRLNRLRRRFQHGSDGSDSHPPARLATNPNMMNDISTLQTPDSAHTFTSLRASGPQQGLTSQSIPENNISSAVTSSDLWSAAYREAVENLSNDIDVAILLGSNAAQLFVELEEIDKEATQESAFIRGVAYLRSIQIPLERFKLALDVASPLSSFDPTAATVFGVVKSVTAIAISFATADLEFARQIGEMLEQISYIDDCDTLGQKTNNTDIHKALVLVYQKILEFYSVAHEILTKRGRKLVMKMVLETDRLPTIIQDFLKLAETLRKFIEKATWEIVEDIKTMLYDREIAKWLDSGRLNLQSQYHARLQDLRSNEACEFLLLHPGFRDWYCAPDSKQLVILGDMGCGKSVAMAFLVDELCRRNEHELPRPKLCYYYCRGDGNDQSVDILSALILALLEQLSGLKKTFYEWYKENQAAGVIAPARSTTKLEKFLGNVFETLNRPLFILIDGLDECDRLARKSLLKILRSLAQRTPRLKMILSSRPEEEIMEQLNETLRIDMKSDAYRDSLIVEHTIREQLSYLSTDVQALVMETLSRSAQGSAIWTKMIVALIQIRKIRAPAPMRLFLQDLPLPEQLSKLYITILSRNCSNDPENEVLATLALQLLAVACRPLSIQELAWAVALAAAHRDVTSVAALSELVDSHRVVNLIYPFVVRIDFMDPRKRQVRLVHQSVRDFVMHELSCAQGPESSAALPKVTNPEALISEVCIRYLLLDEIGTFNLFSDEQVAIHELPQDVDLFNDRESFEYDRHCTWEAWEENMIRYDPTERGFGEFFVYASNYWLSHFGNTEGTPLPRLVDIESLCQAGSIRLCNWTDQNCRSDCAIKARFEFDGLLYDPLSMTSLYGSDAFLREMLVTSKFEGDMYLPSSAIRAADQILLWGDLSRLRMLFMDSKLGPQLRDLEFFRLVIRRWSEFGVRHDNWGIAFDLLQYVLDALIQEQWGNELLTVAAGAGCVPIIQHLINRAQDTPGLKDELLRQPHPIVEAILANHVAVVEYILRVEGFKSHIHYRNAEDENVLHLASSACSPAMLRLLVPLLGKELYETDRCGDTALMRTIKGSSDSQDRYEAARILASHANRSGTDFDVARQVNALLLAVQIGDTEMCRLLVCDGQIDPYSVLTHNSAGQLVLRSQPSMNEEIILQLLRSYAGGA
ncbi:hypothetical protein EJ08DRAFT_99133 [Tothia fuscella]|uniref:NACHT domain-containing protein n=1 Tax=Tothia fuscella TaxID=1048955 RepID=A0A9P4NE22_9PEZI|nr:hypothetical protein EJ08DRAFT_99133 [Tothia fuscella]